MFILMEVENEWGPRQVIEEHTYVAIMAELLLNSDIQSYTSSVNNVYNSHPVYGTQSKPVLVLSAFICPMENDATRRDERVSSCS